MTGHKVSIPGYIWKGGKLVKRPAKISVSERLRRKSSKRVKVKRRTSEEIMDAAVVKYAGALKRLAET